MRTDGGRRSDGGSTRFLPPRLDLAIAAAFLLLAAIEALTAGGPRPTLLHLVVAGLAMVAVAWRRRFPLLVALVTVTANFV